MWAGTSRGALPPVPPCGAWAVPAHGHIRLSITIRENEMNDKLRQVEADLSGLRLQLLDSSDNPELVGRLRDLETQKRSLLTTDAGWVSAGDTEPALARRASLGAALAAVSEGELLTGAERELQTERGLSGHSLPWDLFTRADVPTVAPSAAIGANQEGHLGACLWTDCGFVVGGSHAHGSCRRIPARCVDGWGLGVASLAGCFGRF